MPYPELHHQRRRVHRLSQSAQLTSRPRCTGVSINVVSDAAEVYVFAPFPWHATYAPVPGLRSRQAADVVALLPHPCTAADRAAGFRYDLSILQAGFSLTQMLDRPVSGRVLFEQVIRENLDVGRPDQVGLIFDRRIVRRGPSATPGQFRTRVLTEGVTPSLHVDYEHSKIKQHFKEGRALRTETTINDTGDFGIGRRLCNLPALREVGDTANRRLLHVERLASDPITGTTTITALNTPAQIEGQRVPALPFAAPRTRPCSPPSWCFTCCPTGPRA